MCFACRPRQQYISLREYFDGVSDENSNGTVSVTPVWFRASAKCLRTLRDDFLILYVPIRFVPLKNPPRSTVGRRRGPVKI